MLCAVSYAQNYDTLYIQNIIDEFEYGYCSNEFAGAIITGRPECQGQNEWNVNGELTFDDYVTLSNVTGFYSVSNYDCINGVHFYVKFRSSYIPNPFPAPRVWKRQGESITLSAGNLNDYGLQWSTGESTHDIDVLDDGVYTLTVSNELPDGHVCNVDTFSIEVRDNVELYRATVDLETNLNKVTWQTTEAQAEYISQVKVYRDGFFVGTAPYENGYFLDAIGSNNAARNYQIVGVTSEGEDCPIASFQKGTIHTTYYLDVNDNLNMTWNIPYVEQGAQGTLIYFQVCKYDPITEQLTVVDQVNSLITDYTCGVNQFAGGYPVIAAVFSDAKNREFEDMSFSNMYTDISIQPQEITITLAPGWTWFSYPYVEAMNIASALGDFVPMEGDMIKSQFGNSSYRNGQWKGSVHQFIPGLGYKYFSTRTEPAILVFDLSSSR